MKPKKAIAWQQLKDFVNDLPEEKLVCPAIVWGDERGFSIQKVSALTEDYRQTDEGLETTQTIIEDLEEGKTIDDHPIIMYTGDPIMYTDLHEETK